ncbi:MAG: ABC transporter permease [Bacteroidia bacterium]|nr:ABC transporter permease [Bacteroidia bacterium]
MLKYIFKRILVFIPTLVAITLISFVIIINAPGDPVERMVVAAQSGGEVGSQSANQAEQKRFWKQKLGLDLPIFYFSLSSLADPDTLYKVFDKNEKNALGRLSSSYGNWEAISAYYQALISLNQEHSLIKVDSLSCLPHSINEVKEQLNTAYFESLALRSCYDETIIQSKFEKLEAIYQQYALFKPLQPQLRMAKEKYGLMKSNATGWKNYIPKIVFYPKNQYHRWIFGDGNWLTGEGAVFTKGVIRGDFGTSYKTKQPISDVISSKIGWSLFFSMMAVLLGYLVSIPLGIQSAVKRGTWFDRSSTVFLFILYSMPSFWLATMLLMLFANPDVLFIFPASGVQPIEGFGADAGLWEKIVGTLPYIALPLICYTYGSFAFLSRTMRVSMLEISGMDYIRTARAKGLPERTVIYKHGLRNALLPIITVFANVFPAAIGGSVILETIFTIPGMGYEAFTAIADQNYPMIIAILTITGILTLVGYLISDILYAIVDPRISFGK